MFCFVSWIIVIVILVRTVHLYSTQHILRRRYFIYTKKTVFNLEAIVFSISSIQKVVQFSKSNPTNYLCIKYLQISYDEESRDVRRTSLLSCFIFRVIITRECRFVIKHLFAKNITECLYNIWTEFLPVSGLLPPINIPGDGHDLVPLQEERSKGNLFSLFFQFYF